MANQSNVEGNLRNARDQGNSILHAFMDMDIFSLYSSFPKLVKIVSWMKRFVSNYRSVVHSHRKLASHLALTRSLELRLPSSSNIKTNFSEDLNSLHKGALVISISQLKHLKPFVDSLGLLRVGWCLDRSLLPTLQKHPMILICSHFFIKLLVQHLHMELQHAGPTTLCADYYVVRTKKVVR